MRRLIFISVLIVLAGCEPGDLVNLPSEPSKITVLASNTVGHPWFVIVSPTKLTSGHQFIPPLPDATVKIYEDGDFVEQLVNDTIYPDYGPAFFRSQVNSPAPGHEYMITVEAEGYTTVAGKYTQPEPVPADITFEVREKKPIYVTSSITDGNTTTFKYDTANQWTFDITITFTDPPGDNFYAFALGAAPTEDSLDLPGTSDGYMQVEGPSLGDPLLYGLVIDDKEISGKQVTAKFTYTIDDHISFYFENAPLLNEKIPSWFRISIKSMNEAQYKFLIQTRKAQASNNDPYAQPVTTYTNIENGLGVFGGYTPYSKTFHYKLE